MPATIVFDVQMPCENLKRRKSPFIHPTPAELLQAGSRRVPSEIHLLLNSVSNENEFLDSGRSQSFCLFVTMLVKQIVVTARHIAVISYIQQLSNTLLSSLALCVGEIIGYCQSECRSYWSRALRRGSAATRLLGLRIRIPLGHECLSIVSVVCCCTVEVCASS